MSDEKPLDETAPSSSYIELERFGNYRLVGPLAKGGMAELLLAVHTGLQGFSRVVALKRVLPSQAENAAFLDMFLDEARLAARLEHPNIVRIYDFGREQGRYFMAMEYLPGEDLAQVVALANTAGVPVAPSIAAAILERVAEALHFAHELTDSNGAPLGLVHRDVTPSNVLLTYLGHVKVVDFGIAKAANNIFQTEAGALKGKLGYLSPEQLAGRPLDRRCDVFGMGVTLWELLAGEHLFQREGYAATLAAARDGIVPPLRELRPDVDEELEAIVHTALAREPQDRFQTAGQMQDALEQYLRKRGDRPTERDLARWLEALGGQRRADLKRAIARGSQVLQSYAALRNLGPGSGPGLRSPGATELPEPPRPLWQVALFALLGLLVVGSAAWFATSRPTDATAVAETTASARLESEPAGAFIFLRGEPTGRVTPATFAGLDPGRALEVRLEKRGYAPQAASVPLQPGEQIARRLRLVPIKALVSFSHAPRGGTVRVDGTEVRADEVLELPPGRVRVEVTVGGRVTVRRDLELPAGPQTVELSP